MFTNRWPIHIEWGDCDAAGIVFYPQYFRFFDAATGHLFDKAFGMARADWQRHFGIMGIPLVDASANFKRPSTYGDILTIESRVGEMSRSSFVVEHRVVKADGSLGLEGAEKRVWAGWDPADPKKIVSVPIPDEVRRALRGESA